MRGWYILVSVLPRQSMSGAQRRALRVLLPTPEAIYGRTFVEWGRDQCLVGTYWSSTTSREGLLAPQVRRVPRRRPRSACRAAWSMVPVNLTRTKRCWQRAGIELRSSHGVVTCRRRNCLCAQQQQLEELSGGSSNNGK